MSLSLELCKELKAAGFPQGTFAARDAWSWLGDIGDIWLLVSGYMPDNPDRVDEYACPNSDELIAQIQAEWPAIMDFNYALIVQREDVRWWVALRGYTTMKAATLAEALARLYIALKAQA